MRYCVLMIVGLFGLLLNQTTVNAQSFESYVGGGSTRCIVRIGGPERLTIIPVGRDDGFFVSEASQAYQIRTEMIKIIRIFLSLGILFIFALVLVLAAVRWLIIELVQFFETRCENKKIATNSSA